MKKFKLFTIQESIIDRASAIFRLFGWEWERSKVPGWNQIKDEYMRMAEGVLDTAVVSTSCGRLNVSKHEDEEAVSLTFNVVIGQIIFYKNGEREIYI